MHILDLLSFSQYLSVDEIKNIRAGRYCPLETRYRYEVIEFVGVVKWQTEKLAASTYVDKNIFLIKGHSDVVAFYNNNVEQGLSKNSKFIFYALGVRPPSSARSPIPSDTQVIRKHNAVSHIGRSAVKQSAPSSDALPVESEFNMAGVDHTGHSNLASLDQGRVLVSLETINQSTNSNAA